MIITFPQAVSDHKRSRAKATFHGVIYGVWLAILIVAVLQGVYS